jgi:hypothetical protein
MGNLTGLLLAGRRLKIADYFAKLLGNQERGSQGDK